jgi:hypothetical protein
MSVIPSVRSDRANVFLGESHNSALGTLFAMNTGLKLASPFTESAGKTRDLAWLSPAHGGHGDVVPT